MANKTSQHILSTSANLLGFCLFVITSLHLSDRSAGSWIDEFTSIIALVLTGSSVLSFLSLKSNNKAREEKLESIADILFVIALVGILAIIVFIIMKYWNK